MFWVGADYCLVTEAFSGGDASPVGSANALLRVTARLANEHFGDMGAADFCAG